MANGYDRDEYPYNRSGGGYNRAPAEQDMNSLANDAFRKSAAALGQAEVGKMTKVPILGEIDAGLAAYIDSLYNVLANYGTTKLAPRVNEYAQALGKKAQWGETTRNRTSAVATLLVAAGLKSGKFISPVVKALRQPGKDQKVLAHELAPVLDDIKGKHSVGILNGIKATDNEVIFAHRKRIAKIAHTRISGSVIDLGLQAGTNLLLDIKRFTGMWKGVPLDTINADLKAKALADKAAEHDATGDLKGMLGSLLNFSTGPVAERIKRSNEMKLQKTLQPFSAYEMIRELSEQVSSNPKASSYVLPKSFLQPHKRPEECPLEQYLMRIFIVQQKDMSDLSSDHTEIREALKNDLAAAVKPIAAALRNEEMDALQLVRLVGEGKIIKSRGRAIASPQEVEGLLSQDMSKQAVHISGEPDEYYKDKAFTRADFKASLRALEGQNKNLLVAITPDAVLVEAGMGHDEVKERREEIQKDEKTYQRLHASMLVGIAAEPAETLHKVLAQKEIKEVSQVADSLLKQGEASLKLGKKQNAGDQDAANWLVQTVVKGDKTHLGVVLDKGRAKFDEAQADAPEGKHAKAAKKGAGHHEEVDFSEENEGHHSRREQHRATERHGEHSYLD